MYEKHFCIYSLLFFRLGRNDISPKFTSCCVVNGSPFYYGVQRQGYSPLILFQIYWVVSIDPIHVLYISNILIFFCY